MFSFWFWFVTTTLYGSVAIPPPIYVSCADFENVKHIIVEWLLWSNSRTTALNMPAFIDPSMNFFLPQSIALAARIENQHKNFQSKLEGIGCKNVYKYHTRDQSVVKNTILTLFLFPSLVSLVSIRVVMLYVVHS